MRKKAGDSIPSRPRERLLVTRGRTAVLLWQAVKGGTCIPQAKGHSLWAGVEGESWGDSSRGVAQPPQTGLRAPGCFTFLFPTPPPFLWPELWVICVRLQARAYSSRENSGAQSLVLQQASKPDHLPWLRSMHGWENTGGVCVCVCRGWWRIAIEADLCTVCLLSTASFPDSRGTELLGEITPVGITTYSHFRVLWFIAAGIAEKRRGSYSVAAPATGWRPAGGLEGLTLSEGLWLWPHVCSIEGRKSQEDLLLIAHPVSAPGNALPHPFTYPSGATSSSPLFPMTLAPHRFVMWKCAGQRPESHLWD